MDKGESSNIDILILLIGEIIFIFLIYKDVLTWMN